MHLLNCGPHFDLCRGHHHVHHRAQIPLVLAPALVLVLAVACLLHKQKKAMLSLAQEL
jgi:hypothetical protein